MCIIKICLIDRRDRDRRRDRDQDQDRDRSGRDRENKQEADYDDGKVEEKPPAAGYVDGPVKSEGNLGVHALVCMIIKQG